MFGDVLFIGYQFGELGCFFTLWTLLPLVEAGSQITLVAE